jgi:hypothetical protein
MSITAALLKLDKSLDLILLGATAALPIVAATVVWQARLHSPERQPRPVGHYSMRRPVSP